MKIAELEHKVIERAVKHVNGSLTNERTGETFAYPKSHADAVVLALQEIWPRDTRSWPAAAYEDLVQKVKNRTSFPPIKK